VIKVHEGKGHMNRQETKKDPRECQQLREHLEDSKKREGLKRAVTSKGA